MQQEQEERKHQKDAEDRGAVLGEDIGGVVNDGEESRCAEKEACQRACKDGIVCCGKMERFKLSFIKEDACGKCDENGGEHHVSERLQGVPRPERIFVVVRVKVTVYQNGAPNGKSYAAKYGKDQICRHDFFCFHMKSPFCLVLSLYIV